MQNSQLPEEINITQVLKAFASRVKLAAQLLSNPKAIVIMDGNVNTLNMNVHAAKKQAVAMLAVFSKEIEKEKELQQKKEEEEQIQRLVNVRVCLN